MIQWYKDMTIQRKTLPVQHHVHVDHVDLRLTLYSPKNKDKKVKDIQLYNGIRFM